MTDRVKGFWVALDDDIRVDDIEPVLSAVRQLRGVVGVTTSIVSAEDFMARERVRHQLGTELLAVLYPETRT